MSWVPQGEMTDAQISSAAFGELSFGELIRELKYSGERLCNWSALDEETNPIFPDLGVSLESCAGSIYLQVWRWQRIGC